MVLSNGNSDTSWRSIQLWRLLLHLRGDLKIHFPYLTLQLTAVLVCEEASRSCWTLDENIHIYPVKSKEHYSTFKSMCLQEGSLNHKSPTSSRLFQIPRVKDRSSAKRYRDKQRQREREDDLISFSSSFFLKMISPEHSALELANLCELAVS